MKKNSGLPYIIIIDSFRRPKTILKLSLVTFQPDKKSFLLPIHLSAEGNVLRLHSGPIRPQASLIDEFNFSQCHTDNLICTIQLTQEIMKQIWPDYQLGCMNNSGIKTSFVTGPVIPIIIISSSNSIITQDNSHPE